MGKEECQVFTVYKKSPTGSKEPSDVTRVQFPGRGRTRANNYIIKTELDLVNEREKYNNKLYQQFNGSIMFPRNPGQPVRITLGKTANRSTTMHEMGHWYLYMLRVLRDMDDGKNREVWKYEPPSWVTDLNTISSRWNVKDLIESAVLIESMPNKKKVFITSEMTRGQRKNAKRKNKQEVLHRLYVPLNIGDGNMYTARIVVFEEDGRVGFDPLDTQLYDVLIDKKDGTFDRSQTQTNLLSVGKKAPSEVSIHDLLKNVPDSQGVPYFTQGKRGGITFNRKTGESLVSLFRTADRSTFIHEMGHLILEDLIRYGYKADSDTEISRDLKTVLDYLGISNMDLSDLDKLDETQQARLKEAHEKWARAMEMYVMNGDSPSKALRPILQKMRMWLLDIYSNAKFSGEELAPEVQDVFDRLLATPQEIEESYIAEITIGDLTKENELLKERLKNFEQEKKRGRITNFASVRRWGTTEAKARVNAAPSSSAPVFTTRRRADRRRCLSGFRRGRLCLKTSKLC